VELAAKAIIGSATELVEMGTTEEATVTNELATEEMDMATTEDLDTATEFVTEGGIVAGVEDE
jgi:hypothetical protein